MLYRKYVFWLLACSMIVLCSALGFWQLHRYHFKQQLERKVATLATQPAEVITTKMQLDNLPEFSKIAVSGYFDFAHEILLEHQFYQHKLGVHVLTPFIFAGLDRAILVDRGWVESYVPISTVTQKPLLITGVIKNAATWQFILGDNVLPHTPVHVQYINLNDINNILPFKIMSAQYMLLLEPTNLGFTENFHFINMPSAKHLGYAIQWWLLALSISIGLVIFKIKN